MLGKLKRSFKKHILNRISPENMLFLIHLKEKKKDYFPFKRSVFVEKEPPVNSRILVLSPHPDDEVLGPGGTLYRYGKAGNEIMVVYMTDGSGSTPGADADKMKQTRLEEAGKIGETYHFTQKFLDYKDGALEVSENTIKTLKNIIIEFKPHRIFLPSFLDSHKDHITTNHILYSVLKDSPNLEAEIFGYEVWTNIPFPNYAINITDDFETKLQMISVYQSQTAMFDYEQLCRSRNSLNHTMYLDNGARGFTEIFLHFSSHAYVHIMSPLVSS